MNYKDLVFVILLLAASCVSEDEPEFVELELVADVPASAEVFRCQYFVLPPGTRDVVRFEHEYTAGSHHILLYPTTLSQADVATDLASFDCRTRGELGKRGVAYGADEQAVGSQGFPPGVGMPFAPGDVVLLEGHYLNLTEAALVAIVKIRLFFAEQPVEVHAGTLFFYNWAILVPPAPATSTARMRCRIPAPIELQFATSHMHRRGTFFQSALTGGSLAQPLPLHESQDWDSPVADLFDPPQAIEAGQVIEFSCDFQNDLPRPVVEGSSAETDEMCMFVATYWPRIDTDAELCTSPGSGPIFAGSAPCATTWACLQTAVDDVAVQSCLANTCAASSVATSDLLVCVDTYACQDEACISQFCGATQSACLAAPC